MATKKITLPAFTLLELVIVLAVVAVLLTVAIPAYQQYVQRAERAQAIRLILAAADCQTRIRAETGYYDTTRCIPDQQSVRYAFSYKPESSTATETFKITAEILQGIEDRCGSLSFDHTGTREIGNTNGVVSLCWGGR